VKPKKVESKASKRTRNTDLFQFRLRFETARLVLFLVLSIGYTQPHWHVREFQKGLPGLEVSGLSLSFSFRLAAEGGIG